MGKQCWSQAVLVSGSWGHSVLLFSVSSLSFLFLFLPCRSLSSPLLPLFSLSLGDDTKWPTRVDVSLNPNTIKTFFQPKVLISTYFPGKDMLWYSLELSWWDASLETPHQGNSNEYSQHMFSWKNKKNIYLIPPVIWNHVCVFHSA